jgi:hypothetical protein
VNVISEDVGTATGADLAKSRKNQFIFAESVKDWEVHFETKDSTETQQCQLKSS